MNAELKTRRLRVCTILSTLLRVLFLGGLRGHVSYIKIPLLTLNQLSSDKLLDRQMENQI